MDGHPVFKNLSPRPPGRNRAVALGGALAVVAAGLAVLPTLSAEAAVLDVAAVQLKVNADPSALGIDDATPALSWRLQAEGRGVMQTQYRVAVATTAAKASAGKPDVWDTGVVTSDSTSLEYAGPALKPRTRYYWSVKTWAPDASAWSEANFFETAYLDPSQWQGQWIAGPSRPTAPVTATVGTADDAGLLPSSNVTVATAAGATNVKVDNVNGAAVGDQVTIGLGQSGETVTLSTIGTATAQTTLVAPVVAGATRLYLASVAGLAVGSPVTLGTASVNVTEVGTAAGAARTLSAPALATDTNIKVNNVGGFTAGQTAIIGSGAAAVIRTVVTVGTASATGTGITLDAPLGAAYASGAPARGLGTGVGVAAVGGAAAIGAIVVSPGTGLTFTPQLTAALPIGATVRRAGATEVCRPVGNSQNAGSCKPVRPDYLMRKNFQVAPVSEHGAVRSARLYSTGLGWNEPRINGELTQPEGHLNPGFTDYKDSVQYTTDDVTALIQQNQSTPRTNVVASEIAAGRYDSETVPSNHRFETAQWRGLETLKADLYVKYADGTEQLVASDDSWQVSIDGPTRYADFDNGETYDARKQIEGWDTAAYDASAWGSTQVITGPTGTLRAMEQEHTKKVDDIEGPFPTYTTAAGARVFDVQRQYTGWATIKVWDAEPGQVIRIVYVERRNDDTSIDDPTTPGTGQDGDLQLAGSLQQEYYVSDGSGTVANPEVYAPNWNYAGFQWVQVDGSNGTRLPDSVKVDVASVQQIRTAQPQVGTFETDVPLLNKIYDNVKGSVEGDWIAGYSMDTPTYEKDGWTGDAQIILPTVANIFDIQRSMLKSSQDSVESQLPNGQVGLLIPGSEGYGYCSPSNPATPDVYVPCGNTPSLNVFKSSGGGATPIWDAFIFVTSAEAYLRYDDLKPIETAYGTMTKYFDTNLQGGKDYEDGPGGWFAWDGNLLNGKPDWTLSSGLGDWAFVTGAEGNAAEGTNLNVGGFQAASSTAFTAYLATKTAEAARLLYAKTGDAQYLADAGKYETLFDNIRADFNARWWDEERGFYAENSTQELRQGFQAWAIGFGLVEPENKRALEEKLAYDVAVTRTGHAMIGFVGIRWIWPVLSDAAHEGVPYAKEALFKVAQQTTYPSYGYHINLGYTGVGEYWESTTRTRNHQFQGSIGQWFYEELAGIKPVEAGYKEFQVRPLVGGEYGVDHVAASYDSIHGLIRSEWTDQGEDGLTLKVTVPPNTRAKIYVPGDETDTIVESGSGDTVPAASAPGVELVGPQDDAMVYEVGSGDYEFTVLPDAVGPVNTLAPSVNGTPKVGSTVSCDPGTWTDAESFAYAWSSDDATIAGVTTATLELTDALVGTDVTCTVTATGPGGSGSETSAPVEVLPADAPVEAPVNTTAPSITGVVRVGSDVTCVPGTWTGADSFTYAWAANGNTIGGASNATVNLGVSLVGKVLTCTVTAIGAGGESTETTAGVVVAKGAALKATVKPRIVGTTKVGKTLTANPGTWTPAAASYTYVWKANGKVVSGAKAKTYRVRATDKGKKITVTVTASSRAYASGVATSAGRVIR